MKGWNQKLKEVAGHSMWEVEDDDMAEIVFDECDIWSDSCFLGNGTRNILEELDNREHFISKEGISNGEDEMARQLMQLTNSFELLGI